MNPCMKAVQLHVRETHPVRASTYSLRAGIVGFFHGAALPDRLRLLQGAGKIMRHVKLRPGTATRRIDQHAHALRGQRRM